MGPHRVPLIPSLVPPAVPPAAPPRLLRRQPEDPRDLVHPACKASAPLPAPTSIDLSAALLHALAAHVPTSSWSSAVGLAKEGKAQFQPSRLYIYWFTRKLMGVAASVDSGSDMRAVCEAVRKYHVCDEVAWPYDPKPSVLFTHQPSAAALGAAQPHAGLQYLAVPKTLEAISVALHEGHPIMAGNPDGVRGPQSCANRFPA
jgi:hypothetical protein